ncbi:hypothetical protein IEQ34_022791 [Dendrobium chrysotoxum]|uniref:Uncharacterized protein n=1 Tax=Dendrobium chrysotoxum TaxID=161865 RepID=A0AAV7FYC3_DENCH|nr:hypothetical protein IEQ34_022791 [Dendrobium chrysotoxum]
MEDFPPYCVHCKSLSHSKLDCYILHPCLVDVTKTTPDLPVNAINNVCSTNNADVGAQESVNNIVNIDAPPVLPVAFSILEINKIIKNATGAKNLIFSDTITSANQVANPLVNPVCIEVVTDLVECEGFKNVVAYNAYLIPELIV